MVVITPLFFRPPVAIPVKDGPKTVVLLRANICVPEVAVNAEVLDFTRVYAG
jgi:hypothetical protein